MPGDGLPQLRQSLIGKRLQQRLSQIQHNLPLQLVPYRKGEFCRLVGRQVHHLLSLRQRLRGEYRRRRRLFYGLHEIADFLYRADVAFQQQLIIGAFHRDLADFQILRQCPFGGQLLSGL